MRFIERSTIPFLSAWIFTRHSAGVGGVADFSCAVASVGTASSNTQINQISKLFKRTSDEADDQSFQSRFAKTPPPRSSTIAIRSFERSTARLAAGPVGAGAASTPNADFITFARSKGVNGGLNLDGTVITVNNDWNSAYYGKTVLPPDVLVRGNVKNPQAAALLSTAAKAGK